MYISGYTHTYVSRYDIVARAYLIYTYVYAVDFADCLGDDEQRTNMNGVISFFFINTGKHNSFLLYVYIFFDRYFARPIFYFFFFYNFTAIALFDLKLLRRWETLFSQGIYWLGNSRNVHVLSLSNRCERDLIRTTRTRVHNNPS